MQSPSRQLTPLFLGNGLSLLLVLVTIGTMHLCAPSWYGGIDLGADARTITERRSTVERFDRPGHYALHALTQDAFECEHCEARADQVEPSVTGGMQEFQPRHAVLPMLPPRMSDQITEIPLDAQSDAQHGRTVAIDPPPPQGGSAA